MDFEFILYDVVDHVATVTLNRPDALNAMHTPLRLEIMRALDLADQDDDVRAVIVTGAGKAFCAGADLSKGTSIFDKNRDPSKSAMRPDGTFDYSSELARDGGGVLALRIFRCLKPVIAAVNGVAVGVGASMILPMDIRIASDKARIGFVYARRGIVHECCSSYFLPRVVGISRALEWSYSGRVMPAEEVKAGGLVRDVVPADRLMTAAREIAHEISVNTAPVSIALMRQMLWQGQAMRHPMEAHRIESRGISTRGRSRDVKEGVQSFLDKRPAQFPDKVSTDMPDYFPWWEEPKYS